MPVKPPPFMVKSAVNKQRWLNMLIYGPFGSGKTTLAASAADVPDMCDVLMVDAESGDMALEDTIRIKNVENIDHIRVENFKQVAHVQEYLKAHCKYRDEGNIDGLRNLEARVKGLNPSDIESPKKYRTVIIDSLTEVDTFSLYQLLGIDQSMKLVDNMGESVELDVARFDEFRKNNQMMQLLIRAYRDLPMNVLMVCSQKYTQDELKRMHYTPTLTGQLAMQVQGFVDIVGHLQVAKIDAATGSAVAKRRLYVQPIGNFDAKNRKASFKEAYFDDPTMASIMKAING
jgi:hypothetical protein